MTIKTLKTKINRVLRFFGFNVVKAKRPRARKITTAQLAELNASARARNEKNKEVCKALNAGLPPYTPEELAGKTHYRGDSCPGGHAEVGLGETKQPNSDNGISGPTS